VQREKEMKKQYIKNFGHNKGAMINYLNKMKNNKAITSIISSFEVKEDAWIIRYEF
jgi:hypothetical protein